MISGRRAERRTATARCQCGRFGQRARDVPHARGEQLLVPVVRLGLDVLRQRERHRAGLSLVGEHPHRAEHRGRKLLRTPDPVEEPRQRPERVVDRHVVAARQLQLLQHGAAHPGGEDVAGQQQHRDPVGGRERGAGQHVRRSRTDRGGAGHGLQPVAHPRVADRGVHHALLVAGQVVRQIGRPGRRAPPAAPDRPPPRCRARRCPSSPVSSAAALRRARCTGSPGSAPAPAKR